MSALQLMMARARMNHSGVQPRRFWRLKITANNGASLVEVKELEMAAVAAGSNLCTGGTPFATSIANTLNPASGAFDGVKAASPDTNGTKWASVTAPSVAAPQCLGYIMPVGRVVKEVRIWGCITGQETYAPKDFTVQSSLDSTTGLDGTWTDELSVSGQTGWAGGEMRAFTLP